VSSARRFAALAILGLTLSGVLLAAWRLDLPVRQAWTVDARTPWSFIDDRGRVVFETSLAVARNDVFIAPDNARYVVVSARNGTARVRHDGYQRLPASRPISPAGVSSLPPQVSAAGQGPVLPAGAAAAEATPEAGAGRLIFVYHTHSDESYIPGDGRSTVQGRGGIYDVGAVLGETLARDGFLVVHDQALHLPHDAMAYTRSRRTVFQALKLRPFALLDVHRDSVGSSAYDWSFEGKPATRLLIVVGRQNPLSSANLFVAERVKSVADELYPGLIRGIFLAGGQYNQDLDPGSLLLEVGTERNSKEAASRSVMLFARVLAATFGPRQ
jgi:stage II sporulation protein P